MQRSVHLPFHQAHTEWVFRHVINLAFWRSGADMESSCILVVEWDSGIPPWSSLIRVSEDSIVVWWWSAGTTLTDKQNGNKWMVKAYDAVPYSVLAGISKRNLKHMYIHDLNYPRVASGNRSIICLMLSWMTKNRPVSSSHTILPHTLYRCIQNTTHHRVCLISLCWQVFSSKLAFWVC